MEIIFIINNYIAFLTCTSFLLPPAKDALGRKCVGVALVELGALIVTEDTSDEDPIHKKWKV